MRSRCGAIPGLESLYFVTHDVDLALTHADRILVLRDGRIVADGPPATVVEDVDTLDREQPAADLAHGGQPARGRDRAGTASSTHRRSPQPWWPASDRIRAGEEGRRSTDELSRTPRSPRSMQHGGVHVQHRHAGRPQLGDVGGHHPGDRLRRHRRRALRRARVLQHPHSRDRERLGPPGLRDRHLLRVRVRTDRRVLHRLRRKHDRRPDQRLGRCSPAGTGAWRTASSACSPACSVSGWRARSRTACCARRLASAAAIVIGFLFVFTDIWLGTADDASVALTANYLPVVVSNLIASVILTPILVAAWDPLQESMGR